METEENQPIQFMAIKENSHGEFLEKLNQAVIKSYRPLWQMYNIHSADNFFVICEYQEPIDTEEAKNIKAELSQMIMNAEFHVAMAISDLNDKKQELNANTDWKKESEKQENPIKTVGDKADFVTNKTKELQYKVDHYKSYLSHLKRLEKLGIMPEGSAPWEDGVPDPEDEKVESEFKKLELDPDVEEYLKNNGEVKE